MREMSMISISIIILPEQLHQQMQSESHDLDPFLKGLELELIQQLFSYKVADSLSYQMQLHIF